MANQFIVRDTPANWTFLNPVLEANQIGVESDIKNNIETVPNKTKLGDGLTKWNELPYWDPSGTSSGIPYDLACQVTGTPSADQEVLKFVAPRAFTLSGSGQQGEAGVAATAQTDFIVAVNGGTVATLRFAAAGANITVIGGTESPIDLGDIITITAPNSPDGTLADIAFTLPGVV